MGVQPGNRDTRIDDAEIALQTQMGDADHLIQTVRGQAGGDVAQRNMDGGRHNPERGRTQHHHDAGTTCQMRQKLGMARKGETGPVHQRLFVNGNWCKPPMPRPRAPAQRRSRSR